MRIISGKLKGRKLASFSDKRVRPTTDREKEMIFNKLQGQILEARILDLYAGTGALGLEAYSRGAGHVVSVEKNPKILFKNLEALGLSEDIRVLKSCVFSFLKKYKGPSFDVVFSDPPFTKSLSPKTLLTLSESEAIHKGTIVVSEAGRAEPTGPIPEGLSLMEKKEFSDKSILFLEGL